MKLNVGVMSRLEAVAFLDATFLMSPAILMIDDNEFVETIFYPDGHVQ